MKIVSKFIGTKLSEFCGHNQAHQLHFNVYITMTKIAKRMCNAFNTYSLFAVSHKMN